MFLIVQHNLQHIKHLMSGMPSVQNGNLVDSRHLVAIFRHYLFMDLWSWSWRTVFLIYFFCYQGFMMLVLVALARKVFFFIEQPGGSKLLTLPFVKPLCSYGEELGLRWQVALHTCHLTVLLMWTCYIERQQQPTFNMCHADNCRTCQWPWYAGLRLSMTFRWWCQQHTISICDTATCQ